jgi:hypothetical protein
MYLFPPDHLIEENGELVLLSAPPPEGRTYHRHIPNPSSVASVTWAAASRASIVSGARFSFGIGSTKGEPIAAGKGAAREGMIKKREVQRKSRNRYMIEAKNVVVQG